MNFWKLSFPEIEALNDAWLKHEKAERKKFNVLLSCIVGQPVGDADDPETEAARIIAHVKKHG